MNELYHHGVKGMKWGVRRYQNKDGTLTPAGKKRYYNEAGWFTEEGRKQRDLNDHQIYEQALTIKRKFANDREYKKAFDDVKKSYAENAEQYAKNRDSWLNQTDFKNMDYYQFKDAAYDRWIDTAAGKTEAARAKALKEVIERKVRETIGDDAFNQKLPELNSNMWTTNLGSDYVNRIFNSTRIDMQ